MTPMTPRNRARAYHRAPRGFGFGISGHLITSKLSHAATTGAFMRRAV